MNARIAAIGNAVAAAFRRAVSRRSKRVLVHEILSIQILSTAVIGALAVAGLYWGGQWVLQDNYSRWALQWTEELNELGAPLYLSDDRESVIRLESFVDKYPEIGRVTYYRSDGTALFSIDKQNGLKPVENLSRSSLADAEEVIGSAEPYLMRGGLVDPRKFEILAPVWTESIAEDGLFGLDTSVSSLESQTDLVGFVGLHLDFIKFHDRLLSNIEIAILALLALLILSAMYGRRALRKALAAISDLQQPIKELAKGNLGVKFHPAQHREISEIVEALETTASALSERDDKLLKLANHDSLTGLFNRYRFTDELKQEIQNVIDQGNASALIFIDLDQFKYINDTCGHPAGDRLICKVGEELQRSVDEDGIVARFGGDEFAMLIGDTSRKDVRALAEKILENMRRLAHVEDERVFHIHCSIGITMINGAELSHDELIAQADIACREAKAAGRNRLQFYNMNERNAQRLAADAGWMNKLRNAVDNDEFELRFQPINCIETGRTTHHEVLLRLRMDDGRLVSPDAFLPAAVRFGLMSEIDFWVVEHAAAAYTEFAEGNPELRLSINLSANAFESDELSSFVRASFARYGVPADRIIFEVTESLAVRRPRHVEKQIADMRKLGCKFALDDFGTGYSSFSYLQQLRFDFIKIDGAFVHDILNNTVDQKMIKLIAEIGREAGMQTVAEYVQNAESLSLLRELGVDLAQGYFVGRPAKRPTIKPTPVSIPARRRRKAG